MSFIEPMTDRFNAFENRTVPVAGTIIRRYASSRPSSASVSQITANARTMNRESFVIPRAYAIAEYSEAVLVRTKYCVRSAVKRCPDQSANRFDSKGNTAFGATLIFVANLEESLRINGVQFLSSRRVPDASHAACCGFSLRH